MLGDFEVRTPQYWGAGRQKFDPYPGLLLDPNQLDFEIQLFAR
jgi:hypothetical protein